MTVDSLRAGEQEPAFGRRQELGSHGRLRRNTASNAKRGELLRLDEALDATSRVRQRVE
jgi:hypothetical protein